MYWLRWSSTRVCRKNWQGFRANFQLPSINTRLTDAYREVLDSDEPDLIRQVVLRSDLVDNLKDFDVNGNPAKIAIRTWEA